MMSQKDNTSPYRQMQTRLTRLKLRSYAYKTKTAWGTTSRALMATTHVSSRLDYIRTCAVTVNKTIDRLSGFTRKCRLGRLLRRLCRQLRRLGRFLRRLGRLKAIGRLQRRLGRLLRRLGRLLRRLGRLKPIGRQDMVKTAIQSNHRDARLL